MVHVNKSNTQQEKSVHVRWIQYFTHKHEPIVFFPFASILLNREINIYAYQNIVYRWS